MDREERIAQMAALKTHKDAPEMFDGVGSCTDPECGDTLRYYIRTEREIVTEIGYEIDERACLPSKACAATGAALARGKPLLAAYLLTAEHIGGELGGWEGADDRLCHCAMMAEIALKKAVVACAQGRVKCVGERGARNGKS